MAKPLVALCKNEEVTNEYGVQCIVKKKILFKNCSMIGAYSSSGCPPSWLVTCCLID